MATTTKVVGPFSPKDFSDTSALSTSMTTDVVAAVGSNTLVAVDPVTVLGNVFLIVSTT
jgi:hypothetical protein